MKHQTTLTLLTSLYMLTCIACGSSDDNQNNGERATHQIAQGAQTTYLLEMTEPCGTFNFDL